LQKYTRNNAILNKPGMGVNNVLGEPKLELP
jgi:hypothetical protein